MKTDKFHFWAMAVFFALFPCCVGGYYTFYCAAANIILIVLLLVSIFKNKTFKISVSFEAAVIALITLAYLLTKFWAVDKTMSLYGFLKLLTPFLFMLNLFQFESEDRSRLLNILPPAAAIMTASTFALGQISALHSRFFDNIGDLHGTFEYANAFAIYELIAVIIAIYKPKKSKAVIALDTLCAAVCCVGIYLSNSRTVVVLTVGIIILSALWLVFSRLEAKKAKLTFVCIIAFIALAGIAAAFATGIASKLYNKVITDGPFVERLLYWHDSFFYALHHPFGKGAYAFYYAQPQIQSAYYYVIDVHNDYLQMAVEIGWLPCLCFVALLIKQFLSKSVPIMQKMIILALAAHCFMDYDLQFMAIFVILIASISFNNEKSFETKGKLIPVLLAGGIIFFNALLGLSSYYNYTGNQIKSNYYYKNTSAMVLILQSNNDQQFGYDTATEILKNNDCIFEANHALSNIYFANQRYDEAIEQMELVLQKNPRDMKEYEAYIDLCADIEKECKEKNKKLAIECSNKIVSVEDMLSDLKDNTNPRAIKYGREQKFSVDDEHKKIIEEYKKKA